MIRSLERVTTAGGNTAVFDVRDDTSDAALVHGIIAGREYDLPQGLTGWAIDIGAHIGIVTVALALDNPELRIVAVEALPENVEQLRKNAILNGIEDRVFIEEAAAASDAEELVGATIPITYGWSKAQNQPDHYMRDNRYIGGMVGPNESSADAVCRSLSLPGILVKYDLDEITLLKIDCEGCEWFFLTSHAIGSVDRIIGELHHGKRGGAKEFRALLEPTHVVTMDDAKNVATFEAVRRQAVAKPTQRAVISEATPPPDPNKPEPGLRIRHHVPYNHETSVKRACIWCGRPTDILAETPFRPDLGALPLMVTCGAHMRIVYRMLQSGQTLDDWEQAAVTRIGAMAAKQIEP